MLNDVKGIETMYENVNLLKGGTYSETDISKKFFYKRAFSLTNVTLM
jgi:hypothetical protein